MSSDSFQLRTPETESEMDSVRTLFTEYAVSLGIDLCFQNFSTELAGLPGDYVPSRGALLTAHSYGTLIGCCALRPLDSVDYPNACEMKRLFVRPAFRGRGLGRVLAEAIMDAARQADYTHILLDTLTEMASARALYEDLGFVEVPPYYYNPIEGAHYLMARL